MKYSIGQAVWWATWDTWPKQVTCPDCGGTGRIRCIMHDESIVSVDCGACSRGYEPPTGTVVCYEREAVAKQTAIIGVEMRHGEAIRYQTHGSYSIEEGSLFPDKDSALAAAQLMTEEHNREELARIQQKEKDTRSWAWNASYHRKCIREAQKQIDYHTAKLNVAKVKAKEVIP